MTKAAIASVAILIASIAAGAENPPPKGKALKQPHIKAAETARKEYELDILTAKNVYVGKLDAALKDAMKNGDLDGANRIKEIKDAVEKLKPATVAAPVPLRSSVARSVGVPLPGWSPSRVSPGTNVNDAGWGGMVIGCKWIEWQARIPSEGNWYIYALMACKHGEARPCKLSLNGIEQDGDILSETTDNYHLRDAKWFRYGPYSLKRGQLLLRVDGGKAIETPALRGLYLSQNPSWQSDDDSVLTQHKAR